MTTVIDLTAELAKLTLLRGRTPQTTSADRVGSSSQPAPYRDGALFTTKFSGKGAWERHLKGDELVHILDGSTTLDIAAGEGPPQSFFAARRHDRDRPARRVAPVHLGRGCDADDGDAAADRPYPAGRRRSPHGRATARLIPPDRR
jgi:hypothetical protein